jgi:hypothetical protein
MEGMDEMEEMEGMEGMDGLDALGIPLSPKKRQRTTFSDEIVDEFEKV